MTTEQHPGTEEQPEGEATASRRKFITQAAAATAVGVAVPKSDMRAHKLIDGVVWDGKDPKKYAGSFKIHA